MENHMPLFKLKDAVFQILATCAVHSLAIHAGINMAFSTIVLKDIFTPDANKTSSYPEKEINLGMEETLKVNTDQASWFASIVTIFTPVGSLVSGAIMDRWGRKPTCMLSGIVLVLAWCATALTTSDINIMYVARALAGFGTGLCTAALVYVSEISHASVRPMLLSLNSAFVSFGILLQPVIGIWFHWRAIGIFNGVLAAVTFVALFFIPESPIWLFRMKKSDEQEREKRVISSLRWFYRKQEHYEKEYKCLFKSEQMEPSQHLIDADEKTPHSGDNSGPSQLGTEESIRKQSILKPILLLCVLFLLQQLSGSYIIIVYAIQIFKEAGSVHIDEMTGLIGLGVIRFVMATVCAFVSKNFGRRMLLGISGIGMAVSMLLAFLWLSFATPSAVSVLCILSFVSFSSFGYMVIPWTLIGELLPTNVRGKGSGLMITYAYALMFITVKLFLYVMNAIGIAYIFLFFAIISVVSFVYVHFFIPETLGKTFEEIAKNL